eukprot:CAMPEP_0113931924 /NCGR_PEP_ID=MMETSP1159-20121227/6816_1 /TAXON_ID=88271 /ORGANISM="Picocystis salinarum" /LENGTH=61 /DNA_ID=CAMNT_0000932953 /DNA_START=154 /DNA_END=335 /DNA_ORIENTATION=+ /assembly_acc=CAM_ASM_000767
MDDHGDSIDVQPSCSYIRGYQNAYLLLGESVKDFQPLPLLQIGMQRTNWHPKNLEDGSEPS